jgi:predicted lipoprotein
MKINNTAMVIALLLSTIALSACDESTSSSEGAQYGTKSPVALPPAQPSEDFSQNLMLASLVDNVILPTYTTFASKAVEQQGAISAYCDALGSQSGELGSTQDDAKQSWRSAMATWQMAEVMQIGPLLENSNSLRNKIYSWPNTSACAVDQDVVMNEQSTYQITNRTVSRRGMDAIEYLLFSDNLTHSCTIFGTEPQGWNNRTEQSRKVSRCEFAKTVSSDVVDSANELVAAWGGSASQTSYADVIKAAGLPGSDFTDANQAVNNFSDAMFFLGKITKDAKLATPIGLFANDCGLSPCAQNVESRFAMHSLQNIIANIQGFQLLFLGGELDAAIGFDDYLIDVGDPSTAQTMRDNLAEVIAYAQSLEQPMSVLLTQNPDEVEQVHEQLKNVTDQLKTDFIQSLALELPATSAGDND